MRMIRMTRRRVICGLICLAAFVFIARELFTSDSDGSDVIILTQYDEAKSTIQRWLPDAIHSTQPQPVKHLAFLKVHKAASSTAQNIFLRFGHSYNLTLILAHTHGESSWPNVISFTNSITNSNIVQPPENKSFDLLCCHVIYNRKQFESVLPRDTVYIGIVREPVKRFQSSIKFFGLRHINKIPGKHPLSIYLKNPLKYEPNDPKQSFFNNRMAVEFGFPMELFPGKEMSNSTDVMENYINTLDKEFAFIIISERFDESMIYMRRTLRWDMKDVLYVDLNKGSQKPNERNLLTSADEQVLRNSSFLNLDFALYDFAVKRFDQQITAIKGGDFQEEVEHFRSLRKRASEFCKTKQDTLTFEESKWNAPFTLKRFDCKQIGRDEKEFIKMHRKRMYGVDNN